MLSDFRFEDLNQNQLENQCSELVKLLINNRSTNILINSPETWRENRRHRCVLNNKTKTWAPARKQRSSGRISATVATCLQSSLSPHLYLSY